MLLLEPHTGRVCVRFSVSILGKDSVRAKSLIDCLNGRGARGNMCYSLGMIEVIMLKSDVKFT